MNSTITVFGDQPITCTLLKRMRGDTRYQAKVSAVSVTAPNGSKVIVVRAIGRGFTMEEAKDNLVIAIEEMVRAEAGLQEPPEVQPTYAEAIVIEQELPQ